jgi:hypothetical protein
MGNTSIPILKNRLKNKNAPLYTLMVCSKPREGVMKKSVNMRVSSPKRGGRGCHDSLTLPESILIIRV